MTSSTVRRFAIMETENCSIIVTLCKTRNRPFKASAILLTFTQQEL